VVLPIRALRPKSWLNDLPVFTAIGAAGVLARGLASSDAPHHCPGWLLRLLALVYVRGISLVAG
jgi:hypothetical protein